MILYVDTEHASGYERRHAGFLLAARTRLTYALEDLVGDDVHLLRYSKVDAAAIERLGPRALLLSGNSADPAAYGPELDPFLSVLRSTDLPTFGFCGGHQMMCRAHGIALERLGPAPDGLADDEVAVDDRGRWLVERGYDEVELDNHALFDGIARPAVVRHAHSWQVADVPDGFSVMGRTELSPVQVMIDDQRRHVGTQFHPEWWTEEAPAGRTMIANFVDWAGIG